MEVTFVASVQGHQTDRVREIADRLRAHRPDVKVTLVEGDAAKALLLRHKLQFGPAVIVDGRLEYVGVPRWRFLQERIAQVAQNLVNPRTAAPPTPPAKPAASTTASTPTPGTPTKTPESPPAGA
jgi:hypothetical protein